MNTNVFVTGLVMLSFMLSSCSLAARRFAASMADTYLEEQQQKAALESSNLELEKTLVSANGATQFTANENWYDASDEPAGEAYDFTIAHQTYNPYVAVQSTLKADNPTMTSELHANLARGMTFVVIQDSSLVTQTELAEVNSYPARQYEARGTVMDFPMVMLATSIETTDYYHLVVALWIEEEYAQQEDEINQIIQSFEEVAMAR